MTPTRWGWPAVDALADQWVRRPYGQARERGPQSVCETFGISDGHGADVGWNEFRTGARHSGATGSRARFWSTILRPDGFCTRHAMSGHHRTVRHGATDDFLDMHEHERKFTVYGRIQSQGP